MSQRVPARLWAPRDATTAPRNAWQSITRSSGPPARFRYPLHASDPQLMGLKGFHADRQRHRSGIKSAQLVLVNALLRRFEGQGDGAFQTHERMERLDGELALSRHPSGNNA